jgi:hypothetical protein
MPHSFHVRYMPPLFHMHYMPHSFYARYMPHLFHVRYMPHSFHVRYMAPLISRALNVSLIFFSFFRPSTLMWNCSYVICSVEPECEVSVELSVYIF